MVETKVAAWSMVPVTPICSGARAVEATPSRPRHGPGIKKTTARPTTTRVLTQRGSRLLGASLIISDTAGGPNADPRVPYAELQARSRLYRYRGRHNQVDLRRDVLASSFCAKEGRQVPATTNLRRLR